MPEGGEREAFLAADHNAQMVEHVARAPARARPLDLHRRPGRHRRRAARPGPAGDPRLDRASTSTSPATSRASTPPRSPTARRCAPSSATAPDEQVCVVAAGGSARRHPPAPTRVAAAFPEARRRVPAAADDRRRRPAHRPGARSPTATGVEVHGYVHRLYRQLAACDLAITPRRPLDDDGADRRRATVPLLPAARATSSRTTTSPTASTATAPAAGWTTRPGRTTSPRRSPQEIGREPRYRPVDDDGAARAAALIAELL